MTAQGFLAYELTHSPAYLGLVGFFSGAPVWLFTLYGGVVADRIHRRTLLLITQSVMMILAFLLAALTFLHIVQPWHILVLAFLLGVANAFDAPARQAFVWDLVDREHLTNAVAMNNIMFTLSMVVGPAMAGIAYALFGAGWCFLLNGISFIAIIAGLMIMRFDKKPPARVGKSVMKELKEGFQYVKAHPEIKAIFMLMSAIILFSMSFITLFPAWAVTVLHGNATTNGILQSVRGIGALLMSGWIASHALIRNRGRIITRASFFICLVLVVFSLTSLPWLSFLLVALFGAAHILVTNLTSVILQTSVADHLRGRVLSIWSFIFFGLMPLGSLWVGFAAEHFSEVVAVLFSAIATFICVSLLWKFSPTLRKIE